MKSPLLIFASVMIVSGLSGVAYTGSVAANTAGSCSLECVECAGDEHMAASGQDWGGVEHGLAGCLAPGDCCDNHGQCPRSGCFGQLAALDEAWQNLNVAEIAAEMERLGEQVFLNKKRSAIQVLGCTGDIMGHYPVPVDTFTRIADALD